MQATGIVRRIDDLGRIVIPKEIRRNLNIREGDALELFVDATERTVCFRPYLPHFEPWRLLEVVAENMRDNEDFRQFSDDVSALARKIKKSARNPE